MGAKGERYLGFWDAEMLGAEMGWDGMGVPVRRVGTGSLVAFMASMWVDYVGGLFVKGYPVPSGVRWMVSMYDLSWESWNGSRRWIYVGQVDVGVEIDV